jgi:hypothetical protein
MPPRTIVHQARFPVGQRRRAGFGLRCPRWMLVAAMLQTTFALAEDHAASSADLTAIRAAATAYREALAKGDAEAIRAAWTADGDIIDGWGNRIEAHAAVPAGPPAAGPKPEFQMGESRLRMIAADVALEDGTVDVLLPGMKTPLEGWYSAIWVRRGGVWKLAGVRESERPVNAGGDMLGDLDWMVGDWRLAADGQDGTTPAAEMKVRWDAGHGFLIREARIPDVSSEEEPRRMIDVHQRIGWDPVVKRIRSWSFASDGSRGEATWFRDGDSWVALRTDVQADGRQETAVNIYTYDGADRCVWRMLPQGMEPDDGLPARVTWIRTPGSAVP